jgi:VWFA-related protein
MTDKRRREVPAFAKATARQTGGPADSRNNVHSRCQPYRASRERNEPVRFRIFASFGLAVVGAAIVIAQAGSAAQPPQQEPQPPRFRAEANFVRVDAYPTRNGQPVLDLTAEEFEVLEDGKPQSIQTFEHVVVTPAGPESQRSEPNTIEASRQLVANPRNRVFVLFLDTPHVSVDGSWHAREPLIRMLDRVLGADDLVGIMTPRMSAGDVVLARKTQVMADGLRNIWPWGERHTLMKDERELQYEACYPNQFQAGIADEMIRRKRERATLDALRELVLYLRDLREERKAIVTVSEGWLLYRPNADLTRLRKDPMTGAYEPAPGPDPISVGPDGRITMKNRNVIGSTMEQSQCDNERRYLAQIDDEQYFRDIMGEANRGNATFYTVDPRGLPVFDTPIDQNVPVAVDAVMLRSRLDSLRMLAENTDGMAVLNNNDLDIGLKRIASDLSSYYLLGYYSTNAKLDGKFHNIKVRVKRPGIDVRARKGYRSPTEAEVSAARTAAAAPIPPAAAAVGSAMSSLSRLRPDSRFSMNAVAIQSSGGKTVATVWVAGELPAGTAGNPWAQGGTVALDVKTGASSTTQQVTLAAGERTFAVPVKLSTPVESGTIDVRATLSGNSPDAERFSDILRLDLSTSAGQPMLFRRGLSTGNRLLPAASFQFSRTERVRLEFPVGADRKPGAGRLLDRAGEPLAIPVTIGERTDQQTGQRWLTADITLAPLSAGDYAVEVSHEAGGVHQKVITAIRVTR